MPDDDQGMGCQERGRDSARERGKAPAIAILEHLKGDLSPLDISKALTGFLEGPQE